MTPEIELSIPRNLTTKRWEAGYLIVEITYKKEWLYLLQLMSAQNDGDKKWYKKNIAYLCGYHPDDWERVESITPTKLEDGSWKLTVKIKDHGRFIEYIENENPACEVLISEDRTRIYRSNGYYETHRSELNKV